jgi:hypothetical protein
VQASHCQPVGSPQLENLYTVDFPLSVDGLDWIRFTPYFENQLVPAPSVHSYLQLLIRFPDTTESASVLTPGSRGILYTIPSEKTRPSDCKTAANNGLTFPSSARSVLAALRSSLTDDRSLHGHTVEV